MHAKAIALAAALAASLLLAGCVEGEARARHRHSEGDCWAKQGPYGQSAGCDFGPDGRCEASQDWTGQRGGCTAP